MSIETVAEYLRPFGREGDIIQPQVSTATVELAAAALGTEPARIAKTISVYNNTPDGALIVVVAGDAKLDNKKFKGQFSFKPRMLAGEDVERLTNHAPGGVCPFALPSGTPVYLDQSLQRFDYVFPACGSANSAIKLTMAELQELSRAQGWVDVTKLPESEG